LGQAAAFDCAYDGRVKTVMPSEFIATHRQEIIGRCRTKVATRPTPLGIKLETEHGVPVFLDQLVTALRLGLTSNTEITTSAVLHGRDLLVQGFSVSQVVHDYGDVCQSVTELAVEQDAPISTQDFRTLNRCLDDAIAGAVTQYGQERDRSVDREASGDSERLAVMARELRQSIETVSVALGAIKSGRVGVAGSTGVVLDQSLLNAQLLSERVLAEVSMARRTTEAVGKGI
jgi:hypothetical protein